MSDKSAPPPGFTSNGSASSGPPPASAPLEQSDLVGTAGSTSTPSSAAPQSQYAAPPYPDAPPSYQNAISYPTAAPYGQPGMNAAYPPKPMQNAGYPQQPAPMYYQQPNIVVNTLPQPAPQQSAHPRQNVPVIVHVGNGPACRHCHMGSMVQQSDMCCVICLILLTIFTFPFGLVFLCCLPCANTIRCSNCNRV